MFRAKHNSLSDCFERDKESMWERWLEALPEGAELETDVDGVVIGFSLEITVSFTEGNIINVIDNIANDLKKNIFRREWNESRPQSPRGTNHYRQNG